MANLRYRWIASWCVVEPGPVDYFEAVPLGSSAFYLIWKQPEEPNGNLLGYKIFYEKVEGTRIGAQMEREPPIRDPSQTKAKLAGLEPNTKYRLHIRAATVAGEGDEYVSNYLSLVMRPCLASPLHDFDLNHRCNAV